MEKEKIDRINHLARKHRAEGLTEEDKAEQQALRDEYREGFKKGLAHTSTACTTKCRTAALSRQCRAR